MAGGNPYTNQHTTARTYLKSWASPTAEKKKEKCWTFLLDGRRECGAGNFSLLSDIMCVPDIYTLYADDGSRDLQYETKTFRRAEDEYTDLKQFFNQPEKILAPTYRRRLARFIAYQVLKTPSMFDAYSSQLRAIVDGCEARNLLDPERIKINLLNREGRKTSYTVAEAKALLSNPFANFIIPRLNRCATILKSMKLRLVCFPAPEMLITSDNPAVIQTSYSGAYIFTIEDQNTQVFMPLSPNLLAIFNWHAEGVETGDAATAMEANVLQVRNAKELLVSTSDVIAPAIFEATRSAPEASQPQGLRGHLDPIPSNVVRASPILFEAWGPNVGPVLGAMLPDGTMVSQPLPGANPSGKASSDQ